MKRFISVWMLVSGLLVAGETWAFPTATVTLPATSITQTAATLNGSVTTDSSGPAVQVPIIFSYDGINAIPQNPTPSSYTVNGNTTVNFSLAVTGLTCNTAYTYYAGTDFLGDSNFWNPITFTTTACQTPPTPPAPPQPIPTLSEWAQIMMMLAMIATAGLYGRRMKQR